MQSKGMKFIVVLALSAVAMMDVGCASSEVVSIEADSEELAVLLEGELLEGSIAIEGSGMPNQRPGLKKEDVEEHNEMLRIVLEDILLSLEDLDTAEKKVKLEEIIESDTYDVKVNNILEKMIENDGELPERIVGKAKKD